MVKMLLQQGLPLHEKTKLILVSVWFGVFVVGCWFGFVFF